MSYEPVHQRDQKHMVSEKSPNTRSTAPTFSAFTDKFIGKGARPRDDVLQKPAEVPHDRRWMPGFWRQFPFYGILSILGILGSTLASVVILVRSHKQPLDAWGYGISPPVYLAIASVIANALTAYALAKGLDIIFWRNALLGRTIAELNQDWLCGHNLYHALVYGYRAGGRITSLACIFTILALLRGPLNQRASAVQSDALYDIVGPVRLTIAKTLPNNYTGIALNIRQLGVMETARLTQNFTEVMREYSLRANITMENSGCDNACNSYATGFGFKTQCAVTEYDQAPQLETSYNRTIFETSASLYPITNSSNNSVFWLDAGIRFNVTYKISETILEAPENGIGATSSMARMRSHICNVTGGTVEYDVRISPNTIALAANRTQDRFQEDQVLPGPGQFQDSTIGGFQYAAAYLFTSKADFTFAGAKQNSIFTGQLVNEMVYREDGASNDSFHDPMDSMLDKMREIAFRTAVRAGSDLGEVREVASIGSSTRPIYVTDFRYMAAATVLSIASILAISLTFYGWWELGRSVSLGPLDIAKAFDAPLLAQLGSNMDLAQMRNLGPVADVVVQYGEMLHERATTTQYVGGTGEQGRRRLVMGLVGDVQKPAAGVVYGS